MTRNHQVNLMKLNKSFHLPTSGYASYTLSIPIKDAHNNGECKKVSTDQLKVSTDQLLVIILAMCIRVCLVCAFFLREYRKKPTSSSL